MKKNIIFLMMFSLFALFACNDDDDKGSISPISDATATPNIGSIVLKWTNPSESDYYYTMVTYQNASGETVKKKISRYSVDTEAGENHTKAIIGGFEDTNNYTFTLTAYNANGAASSSTTVSGAPQDANMAYYYVVNSVNATPRVEGACVSWVNEWEVPIYVNIDYTDSKGNQQSKRIESSTTDSVVIGSFIAATSIKVTTESKAGDISDPKQIQVEPLRGELDQKQMSIYSYSSFWQAGYEAQNILDGNINTFWHTVLTGYPHWVVVDLGAAYYVNWLELVRRQDDDGNGQWAPTSISWQYSLDGTNFTDLGTFDFDNSLVYNHTYNFTPFYARYIKLNCLAGGQAWTHMAEFLAYYADKADHYADEAAAEITPTEPDPDDDPEIDPNVEYLTFVAGTENNMDFTQSEDNKYEYTITTTGGDPFCSLSPLKKAAAGTVLVFHYQTTANLGSASEFFWCDAGGGPAGGRETSLNIPKNDSGDWKTYKINLVDAMTQHKWAGKVGDFVRFDLGGQTDVTIKIRNIHFRAAREDE